MDREQHLLQSPWTTVWSQLAALDSSATASLASTAHVALARLHYAMHAHLHCRTLTLQPHACGP